MVHVNTEILVIPFLTFSTFGRMRSRFSAVVSIAASCFVKFLDWSSIRSGKRKCVSSQTSRASISFDCSLILHKDTKQSFYNKPPFNNFDIPRTM